MTQNNPSPRIAVLPGAATGARTSSATCAQIGRAQRRGVIRPRPPGAGERSTPSSPLVEEWRVLRPGCRGVVIATPAKDHTSVAMRRRKQARTSSSRNRSPSISRSRSGRRFGRTAARSSWLVTCSEYHPAILRCRDGRRRRPRRIRYIYSNRLNLGKIRREENILWSFAPHDIVGAPAAGGELARCRSSRWRHLRPATTSPT